MRGGIFLDERLISGYVGAVLAGSRDRRRASDRSTFIVHCARLRGLLLRHIPILQQCRQTLSQIHVSLPSFKHHFLTMNAGVQNLVLSLGLMQGESRCCFAQLLTLTDILSCWKGARKIPFDDPQVLMYVRVGYIVTQAFILAVYYYISLAVRLF